MNKLIKLLRYKNRDINLVKCAIIDLNCGIIDLIK